MNSSEKSMTSKPVHSRSFFLAVVGTVLKSTSIPTLIVSVVLTLVMFVGIIQVSVAFLSGVVTVDSFLIAVIALITPLTIRIMGLETDLEHFRKWDEIMKQPATSQKVLLEVQKPQIPFRALAKLGFAVTSMQIIGPSLVAILGFLLSAMLALASMLRTGSLALVLTGVSFWLMLYTLLAMFAFLWNNLVKQIQA